MQNSAGSSIVLVPETQSTKLANRFSFKQIFSSVCNIIGHALVVTLTIYILFHSARDSSTMNLHVTFCTLGYVCLMAEAIMALFGENAWTRYLTRGSRRHLHWVLQVFGMVFSVAGVVIMFLAKSSHFRSNHGIVGLVSIISMIILMLLGYPVFFAVKLRKTIRPVVVKFLHNFLGIACFALGITAQCLGYQKNWLVKTTGHPHSDVFCTIGTSVLALLVLANPLRSLYAQAGRLFR
ncbi:transmembrane reductase CYB561D2-like isoform X2 [Prorops nasuta]